MIQRVVLRFGISILGLGLGLGSGSASGPASGPALALSLGLLLAACGAGGRGSPGGDNDGNDGRQTCASISEQWQASIAGLENRCDTDQDCMVVGEPGGCACGPTVTGDCGAAVARASYMGSEAERLANRFEAESCSFPSICSCGPTLLACSPQGRCVFTHQFCLDERDAGPGGATPQAADPDPAVSSPEP